MSCRSPAARPASERPARHRPSDSASSQLSSPSPARLGKLPARRRQSPSSPLFVCLHELPARRRRAPSSPPSVRLGEFPARRWRVPNLSRRCHSRRAFSSPSARFQLAVVHPLRRVFNSQSASSKLAVACPPTSRPPLDRLRPDELSSPPTVRAPSPAPASCSPPLDCRLCGRTRKSLNHPTVHPQECVENAWERSGKMRGSR